MKKRISFFAFTTILIPVLNSITHSQVDTLWTKTFGGNLGGDCGYSVQQTKDSGYIITGYTSSFGAGDQDIWLIKTNEDGDTLWTKTFGGISEDKGYTVQQTEDAGYIIIGNTESFGSGNCDIWLIKTDENGNDVWNKTFGGILDEFCGSVQQTVDGGYIVVGSTESFATGMQDVWLIKTDENGNGIWDKRFGGSEYAAGSEIQQTSDSGYIIAGYITSGWEDIWLIKTDINGDTLWTKIIGGSNSDFSSSIQQTMDGGYIITGNTYSFSSGSSLVWLIKTNENGDTLWTRTFGGNNGNGGKSIKQSLGGDYIIAGYTWSFGNGMSDVWLIKVDENGNEMWNKTFGLDGEDRANSIQLTEDGGYIITGYLNVLGKEKVWLLKTTPDLTYEEPNTDIVISDFSLLQNYPNPFNPSTKISWQSPVSSWQTLKVYDVLGNEVATLVDEYKPAGEYKIEFNASSLPSGVYFYQLKSGNFMETKKMILIK